MLQDQLTILRLAVHGANALRERAEKTAARRKRVLDGIVAILPPDFYPGDDPVSRVKGLAKYMLTSSRVIFELLEELRGSSVEIKNPDVARWVANWPTKAKSP